MTDTATLDLRGLSCPSPALLTKKALTGLTGGSLVVLVDTATARDNVARVAESNGWKVTAEELADGVTKLTASK